VAKQENKKTFSLTEFKLKDRVRVKHGVTDNDYPDVPLGGWAGTIDEVHNDSMYTIRWSKETLDAIHPVFKNRCENDGLDLEKYWLGADDLEPDTGGPLEIEHPRKITTRSLSPKDQDDRIRMVFGLTSNDPLPDVEEATLEAHHQYLSQNLVFPFAAVHGAEYGHPERVKVIGIGDPEDEPMMDEMHGIFCDVRMENHVVTVPLCELDEPKGKPNRQLVNDYCYWFWNWR
jgi:hypothetical protein